jgi:hypothetical protein
LTGKERLLGHPGRGLVEMECPNERSFGKSTYIIHPVSHEHVSCRLELLHPHQLETQLEIGIMSETNHPC